MVILTHGICSTKIRKELTDKRENNMAIVMSIKPEWCDKIFSGEKSYEVRKTIPRNMPKNTKVYVCNSESCKVVGEFIVSCIIKYDASRVKDVKNPLYTLLGTCLTKRELFNYVGDSKYFYEIAIKDPILYKTPIQLSEFGLNRPPVSWCYAKTNDTTVNKQ